MTPRKECGRWPIMTALLLTIYAVFVLLDAFVIPHGVMELSVSPTPAVIDTAPIITENTYQSSRVSVKITRMRVYETEVYAADIVLADAGSLRAGLASGAFGRNLTQKTSEMAEECGAILAVNGDYYGFRDRGFVIRNGTLYRGTARREEDAEDLVLWADGQLEIIREREKDAQTLLEQGAVQVWSFGPGLIQRGEITVDDHAEVDQAMRSNPRTAIGQVGPLHYILLVSDGRTRESEGLTLLQTAEVLRDLGCETAYNLDGGGSSTMWFMGEIVNNPTTSGRRSGERSVSDIVYIGE